MSAAIVRPLPREQRATYLRMSMAPGYRAQRGGVACIDRSVAPGLIVPARQVSTLIPLGLFEEDLDLSAASNAQYVNVNFVRERVFTTLFNATGTDEILQTDVGADAFLIDSQTASSVGTGRSRVGRIMRVGASATVPVPANGLAPSAARPLGPDDPFAFLDGRVLVEFYQ